MAVGPFSPSFLICFYAKWVEILLHDLPQQQVYLKFLNAHQGKISGLAFSNQNPDRLLSCGVDKTVKLWDVGKQVENSDGMMLNLTEKVKS